MRLVLIVACLNLICSASAYAAEIGRYAMADEAGFDFAVDAEPELRLNQMTALIVRILPKDGMQPIVVTDIGFDARMPEHNHGMIVRPKIHEIGVGQYRIDGVKLHMMGAWVLSYTFKKGRIELRKDVALQLD